jgi:hypothetical protein
MQLDGRMRDVLDAELEHVTRCALITVEERAFLERYELIQSFATHHEKSVAQPALETPSPTTSVYSSLAHSTEPSWSDSSPSISSNSEYQELDATTARNYLSMETSVIQQHYQETTISNVTPSALRAKIYRCKKCPGIIKSNKQNFNRHMRTHKEKTPCGYAKFGCPHGVTRPDNLKSHENTCRYNPKQSQDSR